MAPNDASAEKKVVGVIKCSFAQQRYRAGHACYAPGLADDPGALACTLLERFAGTPPSAELAALISALNADHGINLYFRL